MKLSKPEHQVKKNNNNNTDNKDPLLLSGEETSFWRWVRLPFKGSNALKLIVITLSGEGLKFIKMKFIWEPWEEGAKPPRGEMPRAERVAHKGGQSEKL